MHCGLLVGRCHRSCLKFENYHLIDACFRNRRPIIRGKVVTKGEILRSASGEQISQNEANTQESPGLNFEIKMVNFDSGTESVTFTSEGGMKSDAGRYV